MSRQEFERLTAIHDQLLELNFNYFSISVTPGVINFEFLLFNKFLLKLSKGILEADSRNVAYTLLDNEDKVISKNVGDLQTLIRVINDITNAN